VMHFFKARNSKRSDLIVLLCGLTALVFIVINFIVEDHVFDNDLVVAEVLLVLIYFLTNKGKVEQKFSELGLDKPIFFLMVLMIPLILLMAVLSAVI
jgi:hypothetical protein